MSQPVASTVAPDDTTETLIEVLQEQLRIAQQEKAQLLAMFEAEQAPRREFEQRLLPPPKPKPTPIPARPPVRPWLIIALIVAALALIGWQWRDLIMRALNG